MSSHTHRPKSLVVRPFVGPVNLENPHRAAHGNIVEISTCSCGATRRMNINGRHIESSGWLAADD